MNSLLFSNNLAVRIGPTNRSVRVLLKDSLYLTLCHTMYICLYLQFIGKKEKGHALPCKHRLSRIAVELVELGYLLVYNYLHI